METTYSRNFGLLSDFSDPGQAAGKIRISALSCQRRGPSPASASQCQRPDDRGLELGYWDSSGHFPPVLNAGHRSLPALSLPE